MFFKEVIMIFSKSLNEIKKGELVGWILTDSHYFRAGSKRPNCVLDGKKVLASEDIPPETELNF